MLRILSLSLLAAASLAQATINNMRGTIPGSLHQCQSISVFFFDTDDAGSKTLLFVPAADAAALGSGIITLNDALAKTTPLQTVSDINSADAAEFDFTLEVAEGASFSTFGFLSDGQGKNLNLDRTVKSPLPGAPSCLSAVTAPAVTTSIPVIPSGFATSVRPKTTSTSTMTTVHSSTTTVPAASSTASAAQASITAGTVVVSTKYLLQTSYITVTEEKTTDGLVTSASILGGNVTGHINGTIPPFGTALYSLPTNVTEDGLVVTDATADAMPSLLSATYTMILTGGDVFFVSAQTALSTNVTTDAMLISIQPAVNTTTTFANLTLIGQPEFINSTMFKIDTYYIRD